MSPTRRIFLFIALPLLLVFAGIIAFLAFNRSSNGPGSGSGNNNASQTASSSDDFISRYGADCVKGAQPVFSASPLAIDQMDYVEPLGLVNDGHVTPVDHVYLAPIDPNAADNTYDIVMPADGRVVEVDRMPAEYIGDMTGVQLAPDDFRLVISFSCRYYSIFIHVHKLGDKLAVALPIEAGNNKPVKIDLKAGEVLAHLGNRTFDWTMVDTETTLKGFITPSLYQLEPWKIHTISPFDVYTGELKSRLEAKSLRAVAPLGGKIDYDIAGALIGNWFKTGTNGYQGVSQDRYWDGHLAIAPDYLGGPAIVYSTGNWDGKAKQLLVKGSFDPATVTVATGLIKIEVTNIGYVLADGSPWTTGRFVKGMKAGNNAPVVGTVLLQIQTGEKLKVEQFPGKTADQVTAFTSTAVIYER